MYFRHLRKSSWNPTFEWVETSLTCANKINSYHDDYPKYVVITDFILNHTMPVGKIFNTLLLLIHNVIFEDKDFKGKFRDLDIIIGEHRPPPKTKVMCLMDELESAYTITNVEDLIEWYKDFETIHPFQDGNGRVGGVIVASYAHNLYPDKGWLAPNQ